MMLQKAQVDANITVYFSEINELTIDASKSAAI